MCNFLVNGLVRTANDLIGKFWTSNIFWINFEVFSIFETPVKKYQKLSIINDSFRLW